MNVRIIPRLDIKGPNLVKGIHLEGLRVLGKPATFSLRYYQEGADELIYMDVVASLYGRNNLLDVISSTAKNIFIPITVGGGIRNLEDIRCVLRAGADKVAINTAAIKNPRFLTEAANVFGSQCIVLSVEAKRQLNGRYEAFTDNGRERTGKDVMTWVQQAVSYGAGEVMVTSIDNEGTGKGYDTELMCQINQAVSVPVIACGGAGNASHVKSIIKSSNISAISAASLFHYFVLSQSHQEMDGQEEGNIEFIKRSDASMFMKKRLIPLSIGALKRNLISGGVACRYSEATSLV